MKKNGLFRALGLGLTSLLLGAAPGAIAHAQGASGAYREDSGAALARHLRTLVANPRNLDALRGAGRAALDVGDLDAAVGFFARAEEVAPRDGRTKAGLGSAFTMLRQPSAALRYFQDAVSLGVPVLDVARDRGLAYDLRGNPRMAQADYRLVLASRPDAEVTRRLALSQAIAGDQRGALTTLDPQVRAKDPAGWRVRAFVLAIGGDAAGATRAAQAVMSSAQASSFSPYFRRMAALKASEKAAAAHFGSFPGDPGTIRMADLMSEGERAARVALENAGRAVPTQTEAGRPDGTQAALGREGQIAASTSGSRLASSARPTSGVVTPRNPAGSVASARAASGGDLIRIVGTRQDAAPAAVAAATTGVLTAPVPILNITAVPTPPVPTPTEPAASATLAPVVAEITPTTGTESAQGPPVPTDLQPGGTSSPASGISGAIADIAAAPPPVPQPKVELLASAQPSVSPSQPKVESTGRAAPAPARPKVETAGGEATPSGRHFAQVGIGQNVAALAGDWRRLRAKAGPVLADQSAWTAKLNRTNRLLVGPFASARDAQAFVRKLSAANVDSYVFSSAPGEKVTALGR